MASQINRTQKPGRLTHWWQKDANFRLEFLSLCSINASFSPTSFSRFFSFPHSLWPIVTSRQGVHIRAQVYLYIAYLASWPNLHNVRSFLLILRCPRKQNTLRSLIVRKDTSNFWAHWYFLGSSFEVSQKHISSLLVGVRFLYNRLAQNLHPDRTHQL